VAPEGRFIVARGHKGCERLTHHVARPVGAFWRRDVSSDRFNQWQGRGRPGRIWATGTTAKKTARP